MTLVTGHALSQQIELKGQVSVHNSKYNTGSIEYVQDAYITAPFATADNTDDRGSFSLVFVGMEAGTTVRVQAERAGLEVVNAHDLERVVIGRRDPLPIYLAERGVLAQAQTELYQISKEALYAQRDALIARLRSEGEQRTQAMEELQRRLGREVADRFEAEDLLNQRIAALEKRLPSFAQELATQNLDFASELYVNAYERYRGGDIAGAVALLDSTALANSYEEAVGAIVEGKQLDSIARDLRQKGRRQLRQTIDSYALKAEGLALLFRYGEAAQQYQQVITIYKESQLDSLELAEWYDRLGKTLFDNGAYLKAFSQHQSALKIKENLNLERTHLASSYDFVGRAYRTLGKNHKALEYQHRAVDILEEMLESDHPDLGTSYKNIGRTYNEMYNFKEALSYFRRALHIFESTLGREQVDVAIIYYHMAMAYNGLGKYPEAVEYVELALSIQEKKLESHAPDLAATYDAAAIIYSSIAKYQWALDYNQRALTIQEDVLDSLHPDLGISHHNISSIHMKLGEYEEALEHSQKAIVLLGNASSPGVGLASAYQLGSNIHRNLGNNHEAVEQAQKAVALVQGADDPNRVLLAFCFDALAMALDAMGEYEEALRHQRKAVSIAEDALEEKDPSLAYLYNDIGLIHENLGDYDQALSYNNKSLDILEETLEHDHPLIATSYNNSAFIYRKLGEFEKSLSYFQECLAIERKTLPPVHPHIAITYENMANVHFDLGQYGQAMNLYREALTIQEKGLPEGHLDIAKSYMNLGLCRYNLKEYDLAIAMYDKAVSVNPETGTRRHYSYVGLAYAKGGQWEQAKQALEEYERLSPNKGEPHRNWALYHALRGEDEKALASLQKAVELGYDDVKWLEGEGGFESLRDMEIYKKFIEKLRIKSEE